MNKKINYKDSEYLSNRQKSQIPRGRSSWCICCDRSLVNDGGRCKVCGAKVLPKRFKKNY